MLEIVNQRQDVEEQQIESLCAGLRPGTSPPFGHEIEEEVCWSTDVLDVVR